MRLRWWVSGPLLMALRLQLSELHSPGPFLGVRMGAGVAN